MKKDRISVAFVGIYEQPVALIPQLDSEFCKRLFGQPEVTTVGIGQEGLVISTNNKPFPLVIVGLQRIAIKVANEEMLAEAITAIRSEFASKGLAFKFSAFGINYEYQYININQPAEEWMWGRFINTNIQTKARYQSCPKISFRFGINDKETVNMVIEPRVGVRDGIFLDVNHHHNCPIDGLTDVLMAEYYKKSQKVVDSLISDVITKSNE